MRQYLPGDHHIVMATLGAYATLFVLYKATRKSPAPVPLEVEAGHGHAAPAAPAGGASAVPSMFSESFGKWSEQPGNMDKYVKSLEQWEKDMSNPQLAAAYTKSLP